MREEILVALWLYPVAILLGWSIALQKCKASGESFQPKTAMQILAPGAYLGVNVMVLGIAFDSMLMVTVGGAGLANTLGMVCGYLYHTRLRKPRNPPGSSC